MPPHTQTHVHTHRHTHVMIWIHEQGSEKCFQELLGTALSATRNCLGKLQCTSPQKSECALKRLHLRGDISDSVPFIRTTVQGCPNWMVLVHKHIAVCAPAGMCARPPPPHTHTDNTRKSGSWEWSGRLRSQRSIIEEEAVEAAALSAPCSLTLTALPGNSQRWRTAVSAAWRCVTGKTLPGLN